MKVERTTRTVDKGRTLKVVASSTAI